MRLNLVPVVPQTGTHTLAPTGDHGDQDSWSYAPQRRTKSIVYNIPTEVEATIFLDGKPLLDVADGLGKNGHFTAEGETAFFRINRLEIEARNRATEARDLGLWTEELPDTAGGKPR